MTGKYGVVKVFRLQGIILPHHGRGFAPRSLVRVGLRSKGAGIVSDRSVSDGRLAGVCPDFGLHPEWEKRGASLHRRAADYKEQLRPTSQADPDLRLVARAG